MDRKRTRIRRLTDSEPDSFVPGTAEERASRDRPMKNTLFGYLYRDASNYKNYHQVVLKGKLSEDQIAPFLREQTYFIPSEVGLPDLQNEELTIDDHIWHEIEFISVTDDAPTVKFSATTLLKRFANAARKDWNEYEVSLRKGF